MEFSVASINISEKKGMRKIPVEKAEFEKELGIKGDVHASGGLKQVSFLADEDVKSMNSQYNLSLGYGDFAENITTCGIDLWSLEIGDRFEISNVLFEVSAKGKKCHADCEIKTLTGDCIMQGGDFARVLSNGEIKVNDRGYLLAEDKEALK
jgi:MOSC domain-containing protein YiiM